MIVSTLRRTCTVTSQEEWDARQARLLARLTPYLQRQPGFIAHELRRDGDGDGDAGGMIETTTWASEADCRAYLRGGAAAMAATWLDAFFPTAAFPDGNWVRETAARP
jgi:heme-degrading monooxygenase HmoA